MPRRDPVVDFLLAEIQGARSHALQAKAESAKHLKQIERLTEQLKEEKQANLSSELARERLAHGKTQANLKVAVACCDVLVTEIRTGTKANQHARASLVEKQLRELKLI